MLLLRIWSVLCRLGLDQICPYVEMGMALAFIARFFRRLAIGVCVARSVAVIPLSNLLFAGAHTRFLAAATVYPTSSIYWAF